MDKLKTEYCMIHGWEKKKGILIDMEAIDDYEKFFIPNDCKEDYYKEGEFWMVIDGDDEGVYDDSEIIDHIEDFADKSFSEWKKIKLKLRKSDGGRT